MCNRCEATNANGTPKKADVVLECSWCDKTFSVCDFAAFWIKDGGKASLCVEHFKELMEKRALDFGNARISYSGDEWDVDSNGWLSNALRLLEEPEDR